MRAYLTFKCEDDYKTAKDAFLELGLTVTLEDNGTRARMIVEHSADPEASEQGRTWIELDGDSVDEVRDSARRWIDEHAGAIWATYGYKQRFLFLDVVNALRADDWAVVTHVTEGGHRAYIWRPGDIEAATQIKMWVEEARENKARFNEWVYVNRFGGYLKDVEPQRKLDLKHPYLVRHPPR